MTRTPAAATAVAFTARPHRRHRAASLPRVSLVCLLLCSALALQPALVTSGSHNLTAPAKIRTTALTPAAAKTTSPSSADSRRIATGSQSERRAGELLVRFRADAPQGELNHLLESTGLSRISKLRGASGVERLAVTGAGRDLDALISALRASSLVEFAEPNLLISADQFTPGGGNNKSDSFFSQPWARRNPVLTGITRNGSGGAGIGGVANPLAAPAPRLNIDAGTTTVIAVIDSGVDFTHPDLSTKRWSNRAEQRNKRDDDGDGYTDDLDGWDFVTGSNRMTDGQGHGTAVTGIIAAEAQRASGVTGVTWRASLMSLRVLDEAGRGDVASAVEAIDYAVSHGAQVINCSWGTDEPSIALRQAIERAALRHVLVVCAAGNNGRDVDQSPRFPASEDLPNLLSVAATDGADELTSWSNWGARRVAVAARGEQVPAARRGGGYEQLTGSSAAAAAASAVAGLVKALRPGLGAERTREMIVRGVKGVAGLQGRVATGGIVDAAGALAALDTLLPPGEGMKGRGEDGGDSADHSNKGGDGAGGSNASRTGSVGAQRPTSVTIPSPGTGAPGANLPNLNQARQQLQSDAPQVIAPVPSTLRRCLPRSPRCHEIGAGLIAPAPTPPPVPTPTSVPSPKMAPTPAPLPPLSPTPLSSPSPVPTPSSTPLSPPVHNENLLASAVKMSLLSIIETALNGGRPTLSLSVLDYYSSDWHTGTDVHATRFVPVFNTAASAPTAATAAPEPPAAAVFVLDTPTDLTVTATSDTQVTLSWTPTAGAVSYQVEWRPNISTSFSPLATTTSNGFTHMSLIRGTTYLYQVRAVDAGGTMSLPSNMAYGTAFSFQDDPIILSNDPQGRPATSVKAVHVTELRSAINGVRHAAGLLDAIWTYQTLTPAASTIMADDVRDLRTALDDALAALGVATTGYTDAPLATGANGTPVRKIHVDELRLRSTRGKASGGASGTGTGTGLTAKYYGTINLSDYKLTRTDPRIGFDWGDGSPDPSIAVDHFSVRWAGAIQPRYSEAYTFSASTDDGVRLWIDGQLLIDNWSDHISSPPSTGTISLIAGRQYMIRMEYYENWGGAVAKLEWESASQVREIVPQSQLYPCWKTTDQFVRDFYQAALVRQPNAAERADWTTRLVQAQGETQVVAEAGGLGLTLFTSTEYANRNRSDHDYVSDLYWAYLQRAPDQGGWDYWTSQVAANGRASVRNAFTESSEFQEKVRRLCDTSAAVTTNGETGYNFSSARLDPNNWTGGGGVDAYSRNHNWSLPLVSLPGRAGLDLGLALSYNSLVWTKDGAGVTFDADYGTPSPGFRLGFPVVQPRFINPQIQQNGQAARSSYLLITPSGSHVELRQVGATNVYESADSSYLQLTDSGGSLALMTTDGTRLSFASMSGEYHCYEVKDRNGNLISIGYDGTGQIATIIDTLGRAITFNYDSFQNLQSITQNWKRETETGVVDANPHTWATFGYTNKTLGTNSALFNGLAVVGMQGGTTFPALTQVGLDDGSYYKFDYNAWGQIWKVTHYAADSVVGGVPQDTHPLTYMSYNLSDSDLASGQTDCPRLTQERMWIENGVLNQSVEVTTAYSPWTPNMASCDVTTPDGTKETELYATSPIWQKGLTTESRIYSADDLGTPKKSTTLTWTQDDESLSYQQNARVRDTTISDDASNHRRTSVTYTSYGLPSEVTEYQADALAVLRTTKTGYNLSPEYTSRRIIGLPSFQYLYEGTSTSGALRSKVGYVYDDTPSDATFLQVTSTNTAPTQHDESYYGTALRWRGNANRVRRYEVNQMTGAESGSFTENQVGYNTTGSVIFTKDALEHQAQVGYDDRFWSENNVSTEINRQTFAYPTSATDPDNFTSTSEYNYDLGVATRAWTPQPIGAQNVPGQKVWYDGARRVVRTARLDGTAEKGNTSIVYPSSMTFIESHTLLDPGIVANATQALDGAGRVRGTSRDLPGSTGGYSGQYVYRDAMGRVARTYNPTEMNASWEPTGDDAPPPSGTGTGWIYMGQSYDWKGRPRFTTNTDGTQRSATYGGCGCAGGEVVTLTDEVGRQQKLYSDFLGRQWKTEVLNMNGTVYATTANTFNARDQVTFARQYQGTDQSGVYQETTAGYDGYGRLQSRHAPEQNAGASMIYSYNADDTIYSVTDGRGAVATYAYNDNRRLVTGVSYTAPTGISVAPSVTYSYDAAGNRMQMTTGNNAGGSVTYGYDAFSRLTSEARQFPGLTGTYTLAYQYTLAGQLQKVTDYTGASTKYNYDGAGSVTSVVGEDNLYAGVSTYASNVQYRAWGAVKGLSYGSGLTLAAGYTSRLQMQSWTINGAQSQNGWVSGKQATHEYYADGKLKYAHDVGDSRFDRAYSYDQVGALKEAYTGGEARAFVNGTGVGVQDGPYRQTYHHDVWGNLTGRDNRYWSQGDDYAAIYDANNRNQAWQYDAAGHVTMDESQVYVYDAAGRNTRTDNRDGTVTVTALSDGDGQLLKQTVSRHDNPPVPNTTLTNYYVRSSVLGGRIVTTLNAAGQKQTGNVYLGGEVLAEQGGADLATSQQRIYWRHENPLTGSRGGSSNASSGYGGGLEPDPEGVDVGHLDPYVAPPDPEPLPDLVSPRLGGGGAGSNVCRLDGIELECALVWRAVGAGAASQCPNNDCRPRYNPNRDGLGRGGWETLYLFDAGFSYQPLGPSTSPSGPLPRLLQGGRGASRGGNGGNPSGPGAGSGDDLEGLDVPGDLIINASYAFPQKTSGQQCDDRLAGIFGGDGTVFATDRDPATLTDPVLRNRNRLLSSSESPVNGIAHIYATPTGAGVAGGNLFTPSGFSREERSPYTAHKESVPELQNYHRFTYLPGSLQNFGYSGGLVVSFIHSGPTNSLGRPFPATVTDKPGSMLVGTIGNFGGIDVGGSDPGYVHTHIRFYSANRRGRMGAPIDPRRVFCHDFGF